MYVFPSRNSSPPSEMFLLNHITTAAKQAISDVAINFYSKSTYADLPSPSEDVGISQFR